MTYRLTVHHIGHHEHDWSVQTGLTYPQGVSALMEAGRRWPLLRQASSGVYLAVEPEHLPVGWRVSEEAER